MAYVLRRGISFCETSGRLVFLDLPRDRYFCLEEAAEVVLRQTVLIGSTECQDEVLDTLVRQGILSHAPSPKVPEGVSSLVEADESALERAAGIKSSPITVLQAGIAVLAARYTLRRRGLAQVLGALAGRSIAGETQAGKAQEIDRIAAAFARFDLWFSPLDQCLSRSIAIASLLARRRIAARLVIGVRLRPFLAHSWVQAGRLVVNDRPDTVRTFSPILVI